MRRRGCPGLPGAHGLAIDTDVNRVFVACEGNAKLVALDLQSMQVVFTGDVGKTPDVLARDQALHRLYVAAETGPSLTTMLRSSGQVRPVSRPESTAPPRGCAPLSLNVNQIGGQAGSSSLIRNYLGFPRGVSGDELTFRAWEQMLLFGAQFAFTEPATGLVARDKERVTLLENGDEVRARTVVIAAGVSYGRLGIPSLDRLIGAAVFHGTAGSEARAVAGDNVYVIGGANSDGQAALNLAKYAGRVTLVIRGQSLQAGMSDYLITQIQSTPTVFVRTNTQVVDAHGGQRLEGLVLEDRETGAREEVQAAAVFVLIGAEPRTEWLHEAIQRDDRGFILTGADVSSKEWPGDRPPLAFETSMPGVFAVGDVRHGSVKRVAGAVGEGSVAIGSVHQYLAELERATTGRPR